MSSRSGSSKSKKPLKSKSNSVKSKPVESVATKGRVLVEEQFAIPDSKKMILRRIQK